MHKIFLLVYLHIFVESFRKQKLKNYHIRKYRFIRWIISNLIACNLTNKSESTFLAPIFRSNQPHKEEFHEYYDQDSYWNKLFIYLQASHSVSFPSLVPRRSFKLLFLNEPVAFSAVPRRRSSGRLCGGCTRFAFSFSALWKSSPWIVTVDLLLPSDSLSGS